MTLTKAKTIFATHMQAARKRKLTAYESKQLTIARQTLRSVRKPTMNAKVKSKPVLIYGKITRIEGTKTQQHICDAACKAHGHRYFHNFKSNPQMWGLPDGSLLIK